MNAPAPREIEAELAPIVGMYIRHRANSALSQEPTPTETELAKVRVALKRNREQEQALWDRYEAEAASDPYFGGQGPRW